MNAKMRRWAALLESGAYKQGYNRLKRGKRYCCLGVAREAVLGGVCGSDTELLADERAALAISFEDMKQLAAANDGYGMCHLTFTEIATALYLADASRISVVKVLTP